jgi:hypothetical protein
LEMDGYDKKEHEIKNSHFLSRKFLKKEIDCKLNKMKMVFQQSMNIHM